MTEMANPIYEFLVEESKVYRIRPTIFTNVMPQIQIVGTGSVNLLASMFVPQTINDEVLQSDETSIDLSGIYRFEEMPNFIKFVPNQSGERSIVLIGFQRPEEIIFE